jgi:Alw26I/Eco31I/Esp3I family type II restriction m6 adenine DNA methyltransferase
MLHTSYLAKTRSAAVAGSKTLLRKAAGRFYTPEAIGRPLVTEAVQRLLRSRPSELNIIDPFCGDGRLLVWTLQALNELGFRGTVAVHGWDIDSEALAIAAACIKDVKAACQFGTKLSLRLADSLSIVCRRKFDLVVTNPPWDILKPDRRDLIELPPAQQIEYVDTLRAQSERLAVRYVHSQAAARYSGWSQNLARIGCELSLSLLSEKGVCGIVLPATLLADQASGKWRDWLFREFNVDEVEYYSAERRLFVGVDQPCITMIIREGRSLSPFIGLRERNAGGTLVRSELNRAEVTFLDNRLPLAHGTSGLRIHKALQPLQTFHGLEMTTIWAGRELDETNFNSYLSDHGTVRFVKGKMVGRYELFDQPPQYIAKTGPSIPVSSNHWRLAWRDVSRPNQKRRMQATLLQPNFVTGNSLNVAYVRDGDITKLRWLLGVMNSRFVHSPRRHMFHLARREWCAFHLLTRQFTALRPWLIVDYKAITSPSFCLRSQWLNRTA